LAAIGRSLKSPTPRSARRSPSCGGRAPATWNRNRAAITSWLTWCQAKKHWAAPSVPADAERRKETTDETRAVAKTTIHRLLSRRDIPPRHPAAGAGAVADAL
jgi:hypothetical protein